MIHAVATIDRVKQYSRPEMSAGSAGIDGTEISIDGIRLDRYVSAGANGFVFEGYDQILDRTVAVKVWAPRKDHKGAHDRAAQAYAEMRKLAKVDSAHIARVFRAGLLPSGWPFAIMEFVEGVTLRSIRSELDDQFPRRSMYWSSVNRGLDDAEKVGAYHGDLHESNVIVTFFDAKIIDFGSSLASGHEKSRRRHADKVRSFAARLLPELTVELPISAVPKDLDPRYMTRAVARWAKIAGTLRELRLDGSSLESSTILTKLRAIGTASVAPLFDLRESMEFWLTRNKMPAAAVDAFRDSAAAERVRQMNESPDRNWFGFLDPRARSGSPS